MKKKRKQPKSSPQRPDVSCPGRTPTLRTPIPRTSHPSYKPVGGESAGTDCFGRNMEEAAVFALEERRRNKEENEMYRVRIVEGVLLRAGRDGSHNVYGMDGETVVLPFDVPSKKPHLALLGGETGKPREPLALYECVWKSDPRSGRALRGAFSPPG